jgi:hypothetical protein
VEKMFEVEDVTRLEIRSKTSDHLQLSFFYAICQDVIHVMVRATIPAGSDEDSYEVTTIRFPLTTDRDIVNDELKEFVEAEKILSKKYPS